MTTKQEIEEFRKYLKNPEQVKEDILQQDQAIRQRILENNIIKNYKKSGFNHPDDFSLDDICDGKLIPTNYCWDSDTKHIIGYPNRLLFSYPLIYKNPRFITFLDVNPKHNEDYKNQIESLRTDDLKQEITQSSINVFDLDELISIYDLDEIVQNVIIPGFLKTLDNTETILNSNKITVADLFVTHNYSLEDFYKQSNGKNDVNKFLKSIFRSSMIPRHLLDDFLRYNGLIFNLNDLKFITSLVDNHLDDLTPMCIFWIVSELSDIFVTSFYQKTRYAYSEEEQKVIKDWLSNLDEHLIDLENQINFK